MSVKIEMEMPKSCLDCDFYINGNSGFLLYGVRVGGKCKRLPIKDMDGEIIDYQNICKNGKQIKNILEGCRDKRCPLKPVEEVKGTISTEDYMKFYKQAEELCKRNPGIKDFEDFYKALRENK